MKRMPSSPYVVRLGDCDRTGLESLSRRTSAPFRLVLRSPIVLLAAAGMANRVIAERLGTCEDTARKWRRRYCEQGIEGLAGAPAPGQAARVPRHGGGRGEGPGVRDARREWDAPGPLDLPGTGPPCRGQRHHPGGLAVYGPPLAR
jgi:hypothetical protein